MSKDKTLRRYISGFLILMASLTTMPASQAAAQIFQGEAKPKIFYSDSGAAVDNPVTNTDLDNFSISLHYGTMEEDLGDTLLLQDASISIPVTVSIEYTGEECYNAGDLTFTLQDIEGLSRQGNGSSLKPFAITTDIGAEKYGSGSNRGDWYYYSEEMENHSNSYVFCNKNDLEGPFTSSVEMISTISHIGTARNGFSQTINSTLSIEGIGDRICRPLYFSNYTSPTTFTMKPFVWEPYKAMWQQEIFPCAGSPDDYEIIRICLDFDQTVNSRIFGDTSPDSFQEGSFAQVNITAPEGIEIMNPDGSFNTPQRICSSSAGDPFLDGLIPESEYIPAPEPEFIAFIPKSLYPAGSSVTITAELHGRYYDDFAPFSTFTTQTIQIPSTADPNAELSPYDSENPDTPISIIDPSETISVSSTAVWEDEDNQDGIRPDFVDVQLYADNIPNGDPVRLNVENNWTSVWNDLPKYISGSPVSYSVKDVTNTDGYTISSEGSPETGFSLIHTHAPDKTSVHGSVVWEDDDNIDSLRPDTVTINLYADENKIDSTTVSADSDWTFTFENIDKNRGGKPVPYTISEDPVESIFQDNPIILYQTRYEQERIINYLSPHMIRFSTSIEWDDNQDKDGNHPDSVTVRLMKNEKEIQAGTASSANDWKLSFEDCPLYENSKQIHYTLKQDPADGYQPPEMSMDDTIKSAAQTGLLDISSVRIKNRFAGKQDITVTASWTDEDDSDGIRPESLTIRLYADKTEIESFSMTADSKWSHTFKDLPVYRADKIIAYTIDAEEIDGYETTINGFDISNSHSPEKLAIHGTITWDDSDNQDAVRPEKIILHLLADDKEIDSATVATSDEWKYSFDEHEIRKAGQKIRYAITEDSIPGYTAQIDGFNVINIHDAEKLTIDGKVLWEDANDYNHLRPGAVTLHLSSNGEELSHTAVFDLTADKGWAFNIDNVESSNADGSPKSFSLVMDDAPAGYTYSEKKITTENGLLFTITGKHEPNKKTDPESVLTTISGMVIWDDANDKDRIRPSDLTVYLEGNGQTFNMTASGDSDWKYTFSAIPKYDTGGNIIPYQVSAKAVDGYATTTTGYNLVNTHEPDKAGNNSSANSNDQNQSGSNSPEKNSSDKQNTSKEASMDSNNSNSNTSSDTVNINGRKVWDDQNDADRIRPSSITVKLYADGTLVKSAAVTSDSNWVYSFTNMPKYSSGRNKITYTVDEDDVSGYTKTINGYTIVNTHLPSDKGKDNSTGREKTGTSGSSSSEKININGTKTWVDNNNAEKVRPDYIIVHLFADGTEKRVTTVTENNGWVYSFPNMPKKNESGEAIKYTVDEDDVSGYKKTVTGYNIVNTLSSLAGSDEEKEAIDKASKESSQKESSVQTGDRTPIAIMIACLVASAAVITIFIIKSRRNSKGHNSDRFAGTT